MADFVKEKKFYDDNNYPHGFSRSGDYTIRESEALENYGTRLGLLASEQVEPANKVEEHFVAAIQNPPARDVDLGSLEDLSFIEKTWFKYQRLITEVKRVYILADGNSTMIDDSSIMD